MRGRKPKLVALQGGRDLGPIPEPPAKLKEDAKAEWRRVAPVLHRRGLLRDETLASLETYCRAFALVRAYTDMLDERGHIIEGPRGPQRHPAFGMLMAVTREVRLFAAELGLTRASVNAPAKGRNADQDDGWDSDLLA